METVNHNGSFFPNRGTGRFRNFTASFAVFALLALAITGCRKDDLNSMTPGEEMTATETADLNTARLAANDPSLAVTSQVNLVSSHDGYRAMRIDENLGGVWGMARGGDGYIWLSSKGKEVANVYDGLGAYVRQPMSIGDLATRGGPSSLVRNTTSGFHIPNSRIPATMLMTSESGRILGTYLGVTYTLIDRRAQGSMYTGVAVAQVGTQPYLFATDFMNGRVDVFDGQLRYLSSRTLTDPFMSDSYGPYNIALFNGELFVIYAMKSGTDAAIGGSGAGYVSIFSPDGRFIRRFASNGPLNAPWGIAKTGRVVYIANHGDGTINRYDYPSGQFMGKLHFNGQPVRIEGLWAIGHASGDHRQLFFTAGPGDADAGHGLFGYVKIAL
jgi:uncharacterized protein (TIGR03118 family)